LPLSTFLACSSNCKTTRCNPCLGGLHQKNMVPSRVETDTCSRLNATQPSPSLFIEETDRQRPTPAIADGRRPARLNPDPTPARA
jgi:hypothetical protein